jgi:cellobiose phosphorylase
MMQNYMVEPYVMCADIYAAPPHTGRGGWSWYTGAAGWMYRLILEALLGLQLKVDHLLIAPCIPADWDAYKIHYRYRETVYHINIKRDVEQSKPAISVTVDGVLVTGGGVDRAGRPQGMIPLVDDRREHQVEVVFS